MTEIHPGSVEGPAVPLMTVLGVIWRRRWVVIGAAALAVATVVGKILTTKRTYTSTASFIPQSRNNASSLSGLAAQFGVAVPTTEPGRSPAFYADLLKTRELLGEVVDSQYTVAGSAGSPTQSLVTVLEAEGDTPQTRREDAIRRLGRRTEANAVQRTGVVNVAVTADSPEIANQVLRRLLVALNRFNAVSRQSQASAERRFTEQRLNGAKAELRQAEEDLQNFRQHNVSSKAASSARLEEQRLVREVELRTGVYSTLAQALEQAKIEEVRDAPVITLIDSPSLPSRPDSRGLVRRGPLALVAGVVLGVFLALTLEGWMILRHRPAS